MSFAVENTTNSESLEFTLDCGSSTNVMTHRGSLVGTVFVPAGETKVVFHLMPEKNFEPWSWSVKWSFYWGG